MRIAMAQYALDTEPTRNLQKVIDFMQEAAQSATQLIVFPELCLSPFFPQHARRDASRYAMTIDDHSIQRIRDTCRRLKVLASPNVYLIADGRRFDASLMIDEKGEVLDISKMVHVAQLPGFYEQDYYTPSDTGFKVHKTSFGEVGVVVCFDRHFPESVRTCALRGAKLVVIPTANIKGEPLNLFECELRAAAMQNGVFIAMCNRVGREEEATFCGESIVIDSDGEVIFKAGDTEGLFIVDVELSKVDVSRRVRPYLALRRPELYA